MSETTVEEGQGEDPLFDLTMTAASPNEAFIVDVEGFEGPLDLLLTLARSQKVDLRNISILQLVDQYLHTFARRFLTARQRYSAARLKKTVAVKAESKLSPLLTQ